MDNLQNSDKPKYHEDTYPWWARIAEWLLVRLAYFTASFFVLFGSISYYVPIGRFVVVEIAGLQVPALLLLSLGGSVIVALVGPWAYKQHVNRGRGKLQEIKALECEQEFAKRILEEDEGQLK